MMTSNINYLATSKYNSKIIDMRFAAKSFVSEKRKNIIRNLPLHV